MDGQTGLWKTKMGELVNRVPKKTILIIEDEHSLRRIQRRLLELNGYICLEAKDGREGLELLGRHHGQISAILLDMVTPRMDGFEFLKALKERPHQPPVLVTSVLQEIQVYEDMFENLLSKPYDSKTLLDRMKEILSPGKKRDDAFAPSKMITLETQRSMN
jgi:CheY-like chemotaxis protein